MNIEPLHIETPLIPMSGPTRGGSTPLLKLDALQIPGSFKIRGMGAACSEYARQGAHRFISSSGGNAGIAVAYAGRRLSIPVTVVVPESTTDRSKQLIRQYGADVITHGATWHEANEHAQSLLAGTSRFLHPFDNPLLWQGHATLIDEVARAGQKPDAILLSVGGGGLLCGVIEGLWRNNWTDIPLFAVETVGADSLAYAIKMQRPAALANITSVATSLGAKRVCDQAFEYTRQYPVHSLVVTDRSAVSACERFLDDHRILVEPACGAALAPIYDSMPQVADFKKPLVVVCGGATITAEQLRTLSVRLMRLVPPVA